MHIKFYHLKKYFYSALVLSLIPTISFASEYTRVSAVVIPARSEAKLRIDNIFGKDLMCKYTLSIIVKNSAGNTGVITPQTQETLVKAGRQTTFTANTEKELREMRADSEDETYQLFGINNEDTNEECRLADPPVIETPELPLSVRVTKLFSSRAPSTNLLEGEIQTNPGRCDYGIIPKVGRHKVRHWTDPQTFNVQPYGDNDVQVIYTYNCRTIDDRYNACTGSLEVSSAEGNAAGTVSVIYGVNGDGTLYVKGAPERSGPGLCGNYLVGYMNTFAGIKI
ncbi:MAG: hypothetical protein HQK53_03095 [Oligoflexia bacterium]|nr:hypothetical protein [Oligoflexia bacterium]